jgi:predicted ABC-type transport system involved in lysophospholipase L1 biosynthesis ATPase subunit
LTALLEIAGLKKDYQALRPLRVAQLTLNAGDAVVLGGIDAVGAQTLVHLITGAALPDEGDVTLFGQNTRDIKDSAAWLASLDGLGMVTARGILIEMFSVLQNIAMSYTLDVDPIDPRVVPQAGELARSVGIDQSMFDAPAGKVPLEVQMRVHLARSLALGPRILIAEHPSASLPRDTVAAFGADIARAAQARGLALLAITADDVLAKAIGGRRLELVAATGELRSPGFLKKIFG